MRETIVRILNHHDPTVFAFVLFPKINAKSQIWKKIYSALKISPFPLMCGEQHAFIYSLLQRGQTGQKTSGSFINDVIKYILCVSDEPQFPWLGFIKTVIIFSIRSLRLSVKGSSINDATV